MSFGSLDHITRRRIIVRRIPSIFLLMVSGLVAIGQTSPTVITSAIATNYLSDGTIVKLQAISYGSVHRVPSPYGETPRLFKSASPTIMFTISRQARPGQFLGDTNELWTKAEALDQAGHWFPLRRREHARPIKDGDDDWQESYEGPPCTQMWETWEFPRSPEPSSGLQVRIIARLANVKFKLPNDEAWRKRTEKEEASNFHSQEWLNDELVDAAIRGNGGYVKNLIFQGADPDSSSFTGMSALAYACQNGHADVVRYLLDHGATVNAHGKGKPTDRTALMAAASNDGHLEIIRLLVDRGAEVEARGELGWTALIWAAREGDVESVKYLLRKGADPHIRALDGKTAIELTEQTDSTNRFAVIEILKNAK